MHNRCVLRRNHQRTLLDRLRRAAFLRFVFVVAAVLASQNFLACAFEESPSAQGIETVAGIFETEDSGDACCGLCLDCANCGGCCTFAVSLRAQVVPLTLAFSAYPKISLATAAPELWTPPTLLRPPISAA
jgi:hypothetical protein